jgi:hypothetical protein
MAYKINKGNHGAVSLDGITDFSAGKTDGAEAAFESKDVK